MTAYYNEHDPFAARWLGNLIDAGHIAPGVVDIRSIEDVTPADLAGFTQCHFFAGIGVWSFALRQAGWPDSRPVWTASCPCQPFSAAGAGAGFDDERHLWPALHWLIAQCRPATIFGEQVASKVADPWVDLVQANVEAMGYAFGACAFPAASVGAPHIRDRTYWVADAVSARSHGQRWNEDQHPGRAALRSVGNVVYPCSPGLEKCICEPIVFGQPSGTLPRQTVERTGVHPDRLADMRGERRDQTGQHIGTAWRNGTFGNGNAVAATTTGGPTNGMWADADWLFCRDGKWRAVEPGTFPLVNGAPSRVGRLRAYGNAINSQAAKAFIEAYLETKPC